MISIITPTYNRRDKLDESITSSLALIKDGFAHELIVIDDFSSDGTFEYILDKYELQIRKKQLVIYRCPKNIGVTGAKNKGAELASHEWCIFMDSDDIFLPNIGKCMLEEIEKYQDFDLIFFRCISNTTQALIGIEQKTTEINFKHLYNYGTPGECLPVIKKATIKQYPYKAWYRGCEGLTYLEILKNGHRAIISELIVRGYTSEGIDRISSSNTLRADKLLMYNIHLLQYILSGKPSRITKLAFRIIYYGCLCILNLRIKK